MRVLRGIGALAVLALLVIGAPLALLNWWGSPWPDGGWAEVQLGTQSTVLGVVVAIGWAAWALMTLCVLVEIRAVVLGRRPTRLRFVPAGPQHFAHLLVVSVTALGIGGGVAATGGSAIYIATAEPPASAAVLPSTTTETHTERTTISVGEPTTAWSLAELHLGDGTRWKEVLDLNRGRTLADGQRFVDGAQTIAAGSSIELPAAIDVGPESTLDDERSQEPVTATIKSGDTLSQIALDELGDANRYPDIFEASTKIEQPGGEHLVDPDLIKPGWTVRIPTQAPPAASADEHESAADHNAATDDNMAAAPEPTIGQQNAPAPDLQESHLEDIASLITQTVHDSEDVRADADGEHTDEPVSSPLDAPWILTGLTGAGVLLAAALAAGVRQRRRSQFRFRRPGRSIAPVSRDLAAAERTITAAAEIGTPTLERVDETLRRLAGSLLVSGGAMPEVAAISVSKHRTGALTMHLSAPQELPAPWQPTPDLLHWHVDGTTDLEALGPLSVESDAPYPQLVAIGEDADAVVWLLNIEDLGVLTVSGDQPRCRDLVRHLASQLVVNPWARDVTVDCIGVAGELAGLDDSISVHDGAEAAAAAVSAVLDATIATVDRASRHDVDVATGRTGGADDDLWASRVILAESPEASQEALDALISLVQANVGRTATSIIVNGETSPTTGIVLEVLANGRLVLAQAGLELQAVALTSDEAHAVAAVYAQCGVTADVEIPVSEADGGWESFTDVTGDLRDDLTIPRGTPDADLIEPVSSLLPQTDHTYVDAAPVLPADLESLAPLVGARTSGLIEDATTTLEPDLAAWDDPSNHQARLSLLGPVEAHCFGKPLPKREAFYTEMLAFLWLHRERGVTRDEIVEAFSMSPDRVRKVIQIVRDWLGVDPTTGEPYLPPADHSPASATRGVNAYQLTGNLLVDWDLFKRLRVRAQARGGQPGINDLDRALGLVSGPPCSQLRPGGWDWLAASERHDHYMQIAVSDVALVVTIDHLRNGALDAATRAADIATGACPDAEQTRLCRAAIAQAAGDDDEADRIVRDEVCNRSDDGQAPTDLSERTQEIIEGRHWLAS